jgi:predicted PurR-regulated permease PerM
MALFVWVLFVAKDVFVALFLAIVLAAALDRPVTYLEEKRIPRILGTLVIYLALMAVIGILLYSVVPALIAETGAMLANLRGLSAGISSFVDTTEIVQQIDISLGRFTQFLFGGTGSILDISSKFFGGLIFAASVFVFSFYLTVGRDGVEKFIRTILPTSYEPGALKLYKKVRRKIGRWLQGQLVLSLIVGLAVFIGLKLLGVKYSLLLGILAAVMELIPYVGPIFSGGISVLMGLTVSLELALYTIILFIIIQQLENHILVPSVMSRTTSLNPVVIIASILIGAKIFGFVGIILAVPAAVLIQELVEDWSEKKHKAEASKV